METLTTADSARAEAATTPRPASRSLFDPTIMRSAALDSLRKLDPRVQARNPVMFVVLVGSVITTILFLRDLPSSTAAQNVFNGLISAFLWFTVLFANFAEAMAEGRGKAQAATLRKVRSDTMANRRNESGAVESVPASQLAVGDIVDVTAGETIPPTARSSTGSPPSTSRRSPVSPPRSSANPAGIGPR